MQNFRNADSRTEIHRRIILIPSTWNCLPCVFLLSTWHFYGARLECSRTANRPSDCVSHRDLAASQSCAVWRYGCLFGFNGALFNEQVHLAVTMLARIRIPTEAPTFMIEVHFMVSPFFLQADFEIVPRIGHDRFLPKPYRHNIWQTF
jgi:hypothetical protein